ncbi:MAG TPA: DMT family transporter [Terriglobia bacterium]|nr:DMT family transporter [Terriglobia bacterium]
MDALTAARAKNIRRSAHGHGIVNALMLFTTFCWASNIVAGKFALEGLSPLALAQLRMGGAAILYGLLYLAWRGWPKLRLSRHQWLLLALMALTGITLNQIGFIGGLARTSVTHTGLIQAIGPVLVLLLASSMGLETLTGRKVAGMVISFAGVALLLFGKPAPHSGAHWLGDLILIGAGAVFAYYTILMKGVADQYDTLTLNALVFGLGAIFLVPFCARSVAKVRWNQLSPHAWWGLGYMIVFGSFAAYLIFAFALQELSASTVAAFSYLQPVMAAALGVWLLGERLSINALFGGLLILAGVYLTERERGEHRHMKHLASGGV